MGTRFEAGLVRGMTELVGRTHEMETLMAAFNRVKTGETQIMDVVGEAVVGKSRIVYEFKSSLGNPKLMWETYSTLASACNKLGRVSEENESWGQSI